MQSEHTATVSDIITPDRAVPTGEHGASEIAGDQRRTAIAPSSLVPALTLLALQFVTADLGPFEMINLLSIGSGSHRPGPV